MTFKELRERQGFASAARLARFAAIEANTISQLDAGKIQNPRYATVEAIADVLDVPTAVVMRAIRATPPAPVAEAL
jgi:transcriptional regulator with XRE-family HTH domain